MELLEALKHPDRVLRGKALERCIPLLAEDRRVRAAVIEMAEKDESTGLRYRAIRALERFRVIEAQEVLARIARAEWGDVADAAVEALAEFDTPDSVRALAVVARQNASDLVRRKAAFCLGCTRHVEFAVEALKQVLVDRSETVREAAVISLGTLGGDRAVALLGAHLALERDHRMLLTTIKALGCSKTLSAQYYLLQVLSHWRGDAELEAATAEALGAVGDRRAFPALLELSRSRDLPVYLAAKRAMGRIVARHECFDLLLEHRHLMISLVDGMLEELKGRSPSPQMLRFLILVRQTLRHTNNSTREIDALLQQADCEREK